MASGAHHKKARWISIRGLIVMVVALGVVGGVVGVAGATYAHGRTHHETTSAPPPSPTTTQPPTPLTLTAASPVPGATNVAANAPISLRFSAPLAAEDARPTITPATKGTWSVSGATLTFTPLAGWVPYSSITVSIPAGLAGLAGSHTSPLAKASTVSFTVEPGSTLRLEQLLAELGYLPVTFTPTGYMAGEAAIDTNPPTTSEVTALPVAGVFSWRFAGTPASLTSQWVQGEPNVILRGAIMTFESTTGLPSDGVAGPQVWRSLLAAVAARQVTKQPYNYLMVSEASPETLQVWSDGVIIASTLANTGISEAPTALGTFPVYARYASTTMTGTNPDGSHYSDPGVLWVAYFNGGDAVHQFPRPGYGYPQSLGCVELPSSSAETVWGMDPIGTLVTVS
jgi:peptidoglycan hydrolase-like protein with peptidoglycan-binding domain